MSLRKTIVSIYKSDLDITHHEIADDLGIPSKYAMIYLKESGFRERDVLNRKKIKWEMQFLPMLFLRPDGEIDRCTMCEIYLIENRHAVPYDWSWKINGRFGDICVSCARETMNKSQKERMRKLRDLGCIVCKLETGFWVEPEIHHLRDTLGVGQKRDHDRTIPLCPAHHRTGGYGISRHDGYRKWRELHGREEYLLNEVNRLIAIAQTHNMQYD